MRIFTALILLCAVGAMSPARTFAENEKETRSLIPQDYPEFSFFQFRAGQAWPVGGLGGLAGLVAGAGINFQKTRHWGFGLDIDNFSFNKNTHPHTAPEPVNLTRRDLALIGTARYVLLPKKSISPVFTAGVGVHYFDATHFHTPVVQSDGSSPKHDQPGASHTGIKAHRGFAYKGAAMLGAELNGRGPESLVWTVAARWFLLPEPREFRTSLSSIPGQALTLTAAVGLDL